MTGVSADRPSREDRTKTVRDAFAEEQSKLLPIRTSRSRPTRSVRSRSATHPTPASISTTIRSPTRWCAAPSRRLPHFRPCAFWTGPRPWPPILDRGVGTTDRGSGPYPDLGGTKGSRSPPPRTRSAQHRCSVCPETPGSCRRARRNLGSMTALFWRCSTKSAPPISKSQSPKPSSGRCLPSARSAKSSNRRLTDGDCLPPSPHASHQRPRFARGRQNHDLSTYDHLHHLETPMTDEEI